MTSQSNKFHEMACTGPTYILKSVTYWQYMYLHHVIFHQDQADTKEPVENIHVVTLVNKLFIS